MNNTIRFASTLGLVAVLGGLASLIPAQAQDYHVRRDIADVRSDQRRLEDLCIRRDREADRGDWRDVQRLDRQIADLRRHIDRDRRDIRADIRRDDSYSRDYNRNRYSNNDGYRYRDSNYNRNRDGGNSYRNRESNDYRSNRDGDNYYGRDR
ncbi:MAG: hypothetical protein JWL77_6048 [Chthonomonadaceae bacterium]|nr:hypothetical protein [Chthonomonadaceae bacterium]